jgi:hypothetical protein
MPRTDENAARGHLDRTMTVTRLTVTVITVTVITVTVVAAGTGVAVVLVHQPIGTLFAAATALAAVIGFLGMRDDARDADRRRQMCDAGTVELVLRDTQLLTWACSAPTGLTLDLAAARRTTRIFDRDGRRRHERFEGAAVVGVDWPDAVWHGAARRLLSAWERGATPLHVRYQYRQTSDGHEPVGLTLTGPCARIVWADPDRLARVILGEHTA